MIAPVRQHPSRLHQVLPTAKRATKPLATDRRRCSQTLQSSTFRTGAMERSNIQYIQIYSDDIICEQNYPCSGYVDWLIVSKSCVPFPAFQLCMAEERALFFAWLGFLSQRGVGEQSLEIVRGLLTLYPRRVPICTPHVRYYLNLPNTKDGNL